MMLEIQNNDPNHVSGQQREKRSDVVPAAEGNAQKRSPLSRLAPNRGDNPEAVARQPTTMPQNNVRAW
jgi:hypothetical protein